MNDELDAQYMSAVEDERVAWHQLQAHLPGTQPRAEAWTRWSEAISRTNAAWRRLNAGQRAPQHSPLHAEPHQPGC